eukprot:CFRG2436T1
MSQFSSMVRMTLTCASLLVLGGAGSKYFDEKLEKQLLTEVDGENFGDLGQMARDTAENKTVPVPAEFVEEMQSISESMNMPLDRIKLIVSNGKDQPASAGSRVFPTTHGYLVIPSAMVHNCILARARREYQNITPPVEDFQRKSMKLNMPQTEKFVIAHEMSHIKNEHFIIRWSAQILMVAALVVPPLYSYKNSHITLRTATIGSMISIVPLFFGLKALTRFQESEADVDAAHAGYVDGGVAFWRGRVELDAHLRPNVSPSQLSSLRWWRDHPPHHERLARMLYERNRMKHK